MVRKYLKSKFKIGLLVSIFVLSSLPCISFAEPKKDDVTSKSAIIAPKNQNKSKTKIVYIDDVKYYLSKADEYKKKNPKALDNDVNTYIKKVVEEHEKTSNRNIDQKELNSTATSIEATTQAIYTINPLEQALLDENPVKGYQCISFGNDAIVQSQQWYESYVLVDHNGDAFRHCYWNALMVRGTGFDWAQRWADAHENGATDQTELAKRMDFSNNSVGRYYGQYFSYRLDIDLLCRQAVRNGECWRINNGSSGLEATDSYGEKAGT